MSVKSGSLSQQKIGVSVHLRSHLHAVCLDVAVGAGTVLSVHLELGQKEVSPLPAPGSILWDLWSRFLFLLAAVSSIRPAV